MRYYLIAALPSPLLAYSEDAEIVKSHYLIDIDRVTAYTISRTLKKAAERALETRDNTALEIVPYCVHWSYITNEGAVDDQRLTADVMSGKVRLLDNFIYKIINTN